MTPGAGAAWRLGRGERGWPSRLEHLQAPPAVLWGRGARLSDGAPSVGVVGSRRPTPAGLQIARELGVELAAAGVLVVSGLARGIDAAAHRGALAGQGRTLAVLGCGIDLCYPPEHRPLRDAVLLAGGSVVSEDAGAAPPLSWRFPRRNRIIAALVEAVIVVEASAQSGALSTARWAADLGREVLAVPGSIRNPSSHGTNLLIRDGVRPYLEIADLFDAVPSLRRGLTASPARLDALPEATGSGAGVAEADPTLSRVLAGLTSDPVHPDELAIAVDLPASVVAGALTTLRLRGAVTDVSAGRVARTF